MNFATWNVYRFTFIFLSILACLTSLQTQTPVTITIDLGNTPQIIKNSGCWLSDPVRLYSLVMDEKYR
jgi:hypothetical protein